MREVLDEYLAWRQQVPKVDIALATVVETWGSSPRPLGSKMIVSSDGRMAGSVSNGCIEGDVYQEAQQVLASGQAKLVEYGVADETAFEVGLACGGHIAVLILGAIHIAVPLHRLAKLMGYRVTVVDARAKFATAERFPDADAVVVAWPDEALANIKIDRSTAVVILTHDPKFDLPALRAVLGQGAGYIGAIGSTKTNANRFDALRAEGFTDEQLATVHGPIGLDLGGRGSEETALGIMAEVTATRHGGSGGFMREVRAREKKSSPLVGEVAGAAGRRGRS